MTDSHELAETLKLSKTMKNTQYPTGGKRISGPIFNNDAVHEWIFQQCLE